jgi:hypothetical protein
VVLLQMVVVRLQIAEVLLQIVVALLQMAVVWLQMVAVRLQMVVVRLQIAVVLLQMVVVLLQMIAVPLQVVVVLLQALWEPLHAVADFSRRANATASTNRIRGYGADCSGWVRMPADRPTAERRDAWSSRSASARDGRRDTGRRRPESVHLHRHGERSQSCTRGSARA